MKRLVGYLMPEINRFSLQMLIWIIAQPNINFELNCSHIVQRTTNIDISVLVDLPTPLYFFDIINLVIRKHHHIDVLTFDMASWHNILLLSWISVLQSIKRRYARLVRSSESVSDASSTVRTKLDLVDRLSNQTMPFPRFDELHSMIGTLHALHTLDDRMVFWELSDWVKRRPKMLDLWVGRRVWEQHPLLMNNSESLSFLLTEAAIQIHLSTLDPGSISDASVRKLRLWLRSNEYYFGDIWLVCTAYLERDSAISDFGPLAAVVRTRIVMLISLYIISYGHYDHLFWGLALRWVNSYSVSE